MNFSNAVDQLVESRIDEYSATPGMSAPPLLRTGNTRFTLATNNKVSGIITVSGFPIHFDIRKISDDDWQGTVKAQSQGLGNGFHADQPIHSSVFYSQLSNVVEKFFRLKFPLSLNLNFVYTGLFPPILKQVKNVLSRVAQRNDYELREKSGYNSLSIYFEKDHIKTDDEYADDWGRMIARMKSPTVSREPVAV